MSDPLDQLAGLDNKQPAPQSSGDPLDALAKISSDVSGQLTNDVGNTVIVPKTGENFADTMKRAAVQGQNTTQSQIDAEMKTAPGKAATVLGVTGGPALAGAVANTASAQYAAGMALEAAKDILPSAATVEQISKVMKIARDLGVGAGGFAYLLHALHGKQGK